MAVAFCRELIEAADENNSSSPQTIFHRITLVSNLSHLFRYSKRTRFCLFGSIWVRFLLFGPS